MTRQQLVERWRALRAKRKQLDAGGTGPIESVHALVLVHFGLALRAHQQGDTLRAIRHLTMTVEAISALLQSWATPGTEVAFPEPEAQELGDEQ